MTMLIICVIVMINTFIVNTINGMKHYYCISLLLYRLLGSDVTSHHSETIIKIPNKFSGVGGGQGAQPLPIPPPPSPVRRGTSHPIWHLNSHAIGVRSL